MSTPLKDQLSEIHFDFTDEELLDQSKLTKLKLNINGTLKAAELKIEKAQDKLRAGDISHFLLDDLILAQAMLHVYTSLAHIIWNRTGKNFDQKALIAEIREHAISNGLMRWHINSTSNSSVEMELAVKRQWAQVVEELTWL